MVKDNFHLGACDYPVIIEADKKDDINTLHKYIIDNKDFIEKQKDSIGAVLFRGFNLRTAEDFEKIAMLLDDDLCTSHPFDGGARMWLTKHVYEAAVTTWEKEYWPVPFHTEDSYIPLVPSTLMFCCLKPADYGGATLLTDSRKVFASLSDKLKEKYSQKPIKITFTHPDSLFLVNSVIPKNKKVIHTFAKKYEAVECRRIGEDKTEFTFEIPAVIKAGNKNTFSYIGRVHFADFLTYVIDIFYAYKHYKKIHEKIRMFFMIVKYIMQNGKCLLHSIFKKQNSMQYCSFADGTKIPFMDQIRITLTLWKHSKIIQLKSGDLLLLNNFLVMHGRLPYIGERCLLSSMGSIVNLKKMHTN